MRARVKLESLLKPMHILKTESVVTKLVLQM